MRLLLLLVGVVFCVWAGFINADWVQYGNPGLLFPCGVAAGLVAAFPWPEDFSYRNYYRRG